MQWKDSTLTFYLPPLPLYTEAKVLAMSATLNKHFFEKVFEHRQAKRGDVGFIDADDTEWHPEAKVFQLRTNRNPRGTLLTAEKNKKGKWHYTGLTPTGQQAYNQTLAYAKAHPDKQHAVISYKWLIETHASELQDHGIITGHFGNLVGLDQHFLRDTDTGIVLHIIGAPEVPPHETQHRSELLFGNRATPPDFTRDETTGKYQDPDVHAVYEAGVKSELMQAIGRAGLVKNPSLVILRTSHELPSVSHREQTLHFDETDETGTLDELLTNIKARESREQAEAKAVASGDVDAYVEATGQSKSTAKRKTKATRDQQKADRNAQVISLFQDGLNASEIHRETSISRATINRILEPLKKGDQKAHTLYSTYIEHDPNGHPTTNPVDTHLDTNESEASPMTAERTAELLLAGIHPDGTPITEREPQTSTAEVSQLPAHLRELCEIIDIPDHLHAAYLPINVHENLQEYAYPQHTPSEVFETAESYRQHIETQRAEELNAYKNEALRQYHATVDIHEIARSLHVNPLIIKKWLQAAHF